MRKSIISVLLILMLGILVACGGDEGSISVNNGGGAPTNAIEIHIVFAPESNDYMPDIIAAFNQSYRNGVNPLTGQSLAGDERPIFVTGEPGSSGTVMQGIVNAFIAPNNANVFKPTIFQPSVSHWLALANFLSGREIFDLAEAQPTANAPVVMAIWESRLKAIQETVGYEDIGWEELLMVLNSENGWQDFGIAGGRRTVYYGHTDPFISSTALSTLIAEYYASARDNGFTGRRLGMEQVRDSEIQEGVRTIENLIRHYSARTTEFKNYIAQGPNYLDFVALEENDLIAINRGLTEYKPPEKLVALYPKEGTFWHEHPFGIVNADWVTADQQAAARVFADYMLTPDNQTKIMSFGFRPVNPDVELGFPFEDINGVTQNGPTTVLDVPDAEVIAAIQESWSFVKKQADIMLLIDVSGSMEDQDKLIQARQAALAFIENTEPGNRVGLYVFNHIVTERVPLGNLETNKTELRNAIEMLRPGGGTALYDAVAQVTEVMNQDDDDNKNRIRAVVVLSDGQDEDSTIHASVSSVVSIIESSGSSLNPVIVIPVAYGSNADTRTLNSIARASNTTPQSGDPANILRVLEIISSYF